MQKSISRRAASSFIAAVLLTAIVAGTTASGADTLLERVTRIVVLHLAVEKDKVTESARFIGDLGADRLDKVELVMAFEEEFSVKIPDQVAKKIITVGDAVTIISKLTARKLE